MFSQHWKSLLLAGSAITILTGGQATAWAADAAPVASAASDNEIQAVTVTARRREETLKDVPIAVSAYSAARMEQTGAFDVTDLQQTTPNATIQTARGSNSTLIAFIRGVGQQDPLWGFEPGVGVYVDDVYFARPQLAVLDIYDVKDIEILRGPQGTLYGRNTIGGALKYTSARIGSTPQVFAKGEFGSYNQHDEIAGFKLPVNGDLGVSATIAKYDHDGWGTNINTGKDQYNKDVIAGRGTVEWTPTSSLFLRLAADFTEDDSNPRNGHREAAFGAYGVLPGIYDSAAGAGDHNLVKNGGVALTAEYKINDHYTLKSITAVRAGRTTTTIDFDNEPAPILDIPGQYKDRQTSQELQLLFNLDKLHGVAGLYYLSSLASGAFDTELGVYAPFPSNPGYTILDQGYVRTHSFSAFADGSYDLSDRLQISVGGRWTEDDKTGHVLRQAYIGRRSPVFGNPLAVAFGAPNTNYTADKTFEKFTPRFSASYKLTPDVTTYASWSEGFKSGGFDMRGDAKLYPATVNGYRPETVSTTEVGLKGSMANHSFNYAVDVFSSDYKDQQITTQYPSGATIASVVDNVGASTIRGVEAEGNLRTGEHLSFSGSLGYIDAAFDKYLAYVPGQGVVDVSSQRKFQNTPKWTGSFSASYAQSLGDLGKVVLTPAVSYRSAYQMFETATPLLDQRSFWLANFDAVWKSADGRYEAGFHAKNFANAKYKIGGYNFPGALYGNSIVSFYGAPSTYTVTLGVHF